MGLVFLGSTDLMAGHRTSRWLAPLVRWLAPGISGPTLERVQLVVRKAGHICEYAVLGALVCWALTQSEADAGPRRRLAMVLLAAWSWAVIYAVTDEFHQSLVATRQGSLWDVAIDAGGAGLGVLGWWRWPWRRGNNP
jgi:VanZ family protein